MSKTKSVYHQLVYALNTKEYFYILYTKKHTSDYTNKKYNKFLYYLLTYHHYGGIIITVKRKTTKNGKRLYIMTNLTNLINKETTLFELDNLMIKEGFYSIFDELSLKSMKEMESLAFQEKATDDIFDIKFKVINDEENIIKVTEINKL